jgi:hypothetical protein
MRVYLPLDPAIRQQMDIDEITIILAPENRDKIPTYKQAQAQAKRFFKANEAAVTIDMIYRGPLKGQVWYGRHDKYGNIEPIWCFTGNHGKLADI